MYLRLICAKLELFGPVILQKILKFCQSILVFSNYLPLEKEVRLLQFKKLDTYRWSEVVPHFVGECDMGHPGRHALSVVNEGHDPSVEAFLYSAAPLTDRLVALTYTPSRGWNIKSKDWTYSLVTCSDVNNHVFLSLTFILRQIQTIHH